MKKSTKLLRKIIVGLIGFPLLLIGLVLIPLPGPGVLVSLLAFFVLSLEFDWAEKYFKQAVSIIKRIWHEAQERSARFEERHTQPKDKPKK